MSQKKIIGKREIVSILDLELFDLDVKIDTGADSNSLHCDDIYIDDENFVHFTLLDKVHPAYHTKKIKMPLYKMKKVKSSNGTIQIRASIKVDILFFNKKYTTVISLTNRSDMKYPMLIGRKFLANRFLVDVSQEYLTKAK
jgi:hypothetical protein